MSEDFCTICQTTLMVRGYEIKYETNVEKMKLVKIQFRKVSMRTH